MVGVILMTNSLTPDAPVVAQDRQHWQTASAASDLMAEEAALETRLLGVAAESDLHRLVDGVSGSAERAIATDLSPRSKIRIAAW